MPTFDLHYHANVYRLSQAAATRRLAAHRRYFQQNAVDYIASTEHIYKDPWSAFLRLQEISDGTNTTILPAVEGLSSEGIELIYVFPTKELLKDAISDLVQYRWGVFELASMAESWGAISIIPHPFSPGRTGAANKLSESDYQRLVNSVHYVEIHNGSSLSLRKLTNLRRIRKGIPKGFRQKVEKTYDLPISHRGIHTGWSVASDTHFPGEQVFVGYTDLKLVDPENPTGFLSDRIKFTAKRVGADTHIAKSMIKNGKCVISEAWLKRHKTLIASRLSCKQSFEPKS